MVITVTPNEENISQEFVISLRIFRKLVTEMGCEPRISDSWFFPLLHLSPQFMENLWGKLSSGLLGLLTGEVDMCGDGPWPPITPNTPEGPGQKLSPSPTHSMC